MNKVTLNSFNVVENCTIILSGLGISIHNKGKSIVLINGIIKLEPNEIYSVDGFGGCFYEEPFKIDFSEGDRVVNNLLINEVKLK